MALSAGEMRHRVTVRAPAGTLATTAVVVASRISASIAAARAADGGERIAGGGMHSISMTTVKLRFRRDIQASYEVVEHCCLQRTFQIVSLEPSDERDAMVLTCVTVG